MKKKIIFKRELLRKLYCENKFSTHKIGKIYNCSHAKIHYWLKKFDIPLRTKKACKIGKLNPMWKGDKVGLTALHDWIKRHKPKVELCEKCNKEPSYDLANISGKYKRDINDFVWLCRSCHMKSDGRLDKLNKTKKRRYKGDLLECRKCKKFLLKSTFGKDKSREDRHVTICKKCRRIYYQKNKEKLSIKAKEYYQKNKEKKGKEE